jgi:hypothetical protein
LLEGGSLEGPLFFTMNEEKSLPRINTNRLRRDSTTNPHEQIRTEEGSVPWHEKWDFLHGEWEFNAVLSPFNRS